MNTMSKKEAVERLVALEELTQATGVKTYKTQNTILASLSPEVLMEVAVELKHRAVILKSLITEPNTKGTAATASNAR
jgi:hypothetical protein